VMTPVSSRMTQHPRIQVTSAEITFTNPSQHSQPGGSQVVARYTASRFIVRKSPRSTLIWFSPRSYGLRTDNLWVQFLEVKKTVGTFVGAMSAVSRRPEPMSPIDWTRILASRGTTGVECVPTERFASMSWMSWI
jgi:hypothetical protein